MYGIAAQGNTAIALSGRAAARFRRLRDNSTRQLRVLHLVAQPNRKGYCDDPAGVFFRADAGRQLSRTEQMRVRCRVRLRKCRKRSAAPPTEATRTRRRFDLSWLRTSVGILLEKAAVAAVAIE
eukprot:754873-Pleurochrysis_carterae.AAC.3